MESVPRLQTDSSPALAAQAQQFLGVLESGARRVTQRGLPQTERRLSEKRWLVLPRKDFLLPHVTGRTATRDQED